MKATDKGEARPAEGHSRPEEVACGCEALYRTILRLDTLDKLT